MKTPTFLLTLLAVFMAAPTAWALNPETADLILGSPVVDLPRGSVDEDEDDTWFLGADDCAAMIDNSRVGVAFATSFNPQSDRDLIEEITMFAVGRDSTAKIDCSSGELCTLVDDDDVTYGASSINVDVAFADLLATGDISSCDEPFDLEFFVRATVEKSTNSDETENADAKIVVDTVAPDAPGGLTASATENTLAVDFSAADDADIDRYFVVWSESAFEAGADVDALDLDRKVVAEAGAANVAVSLEPDTEVWVAVVSEDFAGNLSPASEVVMVNVLATNDFWEEYKMAGGSEEGGCATAPTRAPGSFLLLVCGLLLLRRRRRLIAPVVVATLVSLPVVVSAETPTWGAFELKFGGYYPAIDDEFDGAGPFGDIFGTNRKIMGEIEVDGWIWQGFGKLGVGGNIGYSRRKGSAVATGDLATDSETTVDDTTAFTVIPMRLSAVYRLDWLAQNTAVPLSATVKLGPDFYRWRVANSNGDTAEFEGDRGAGWKKGWHMTLGLQLLLDFIDPGTAAGFDLAWGVNNSYFFAEYMITRVDDFGGGGFDLSDNIWMFGLSFEF